MPTAATTSWEIDNGKPKKMRQTNIDLENDLENWVETDPSMIEDGLRILARQLDVGCGPLDLLAVGPEGDLVIIELKKKDVYRVTLGQVIDYASAIASLDYTELGAQVDANRKARNYPGTMEECLRKVIGDADLSTWSPASAGVRMIIAGTGADDSVRRIVQFLSGRFDVPINAVFFDVRETSKSTKILTRTGVLSDESVRAKSQRGRGGDPEVLWEEADRAGTSAIIRALKAPMETIWGRKSRAERGGYWSIGSASDGRTTVVQIWPGDANSGKALVYVNLDILAKDINASSDDIKTKLTPHEMEDGWMEFRVSAEEAANKLVVSLQALYPNSGEDDA